MHRWIWLVCATAGIAAASGTLANSSPQQQTLEARQAAAHAVTGELAKTLGKALQAAMRDGGPAAAVHVCRDVGPQTKRDISARTYAQCSTSTTRTTKPSTTGRASCAAPSR